MPLEIAAELLADAVAWTLHPGTHVLIQALQAAISPSSDLELRN